MKIILNMKVSDNMKEYIDIKNKVYECYSKYKKIDVDNIQDINDSICEINKGDFENEMLELYNTVAMCMYMIEHDLYDEYFFEAYSDILTELGNKEFDNVLSKDIDTINDYLKKDEIKSEYYDKLSTLYEDKY